MLFHAGRKEAEARIHRSSHQYCSQGAMGGQDDAEFPASSGRAAYSAHYSTKNLGEVSSPVRHSALNAVGPYQIVNAPRDLPANGGSATILIQFTPASNLVYDEILTFTTTTGRVDVRLIGNGVNPRLDIDPGNGVLDMGNCVSGEVLKSSFTLSNPGISP